MELKMVDSRILVALVLTIARLVRAEDFAQTDNPVSLEALDEFRSKGWPLSDGDQLRARLLGLEPGRPLQIRAALRRFLVDPSALAAGPQPQQLPNEPDYEQELRLLQKKANLMPAKEYSRLVETAIESAARKFTRDPSKSQEVRMPSSQSPTISASGHKSIRTEHPSYMRLPPRFGKRSYFATE